MSFEAMIRDATIADAAAIARVQVAAWRVAYAGVMAEDFLAGMNLERMALRWRDLLSEQLATPGQGSVLVADAGVDLGVVGWCAVGRARDNVADDPAWRTGGVAGFPGAELRALNLHPEAFGSGVAAALHRQALSLMSGLAESAYLWVVDSNLRARRFYEREGWAPDGVEKLADLGGARIRELRYVRALRPGRLDP